MQQILGIVLPTFISIGIGYLFGRLTRVDIAPVVEVTMFLLLPALAFTSMITKEIVLAEAARIWLATFIVTGGTALAAFAVFRALGQSHSGLYVPIVFMNTVNVPFPIVYLAFGREGLAIATLYYIPTALMVYSIGIFLAAGGRSWRASLREMAKVPLIYASVLGLIVNLLHWQPPELLMESLDFLGVAGIPLVLIVLGVNLANSRLGSFPVVALASVLRMVGGFLLGLAAVVLLGLTGVARDVTLLISAMPAAVFAAIITTRYENEKELVASTVLVTTLASLVTIPAMLAWLL